AVTMAVQNGVMTILNPAPAQPVPASLLSAVNFLTPNETEAELLSGLTVTDPDLAGDSWAAAAAQRLLASGPRTVIITLGSRGAYVVTRSDQRLIPAYPVAVVDTTAAGDAFNG